MKTNGIFSQILRTREAHAAACGYDVRKLTAFYRDQQAWHPDPGHPVVSLIGEPRREDSRVSPEEQGAQPWPADEVIAEIRATRARLAEEPSCILREESLPP